MSQTLEQAAARARARVDQAAGGPARRHVVIVLACVVGLDAADKASLSAVAKNLEHSFGIGNTKLGVLMSIVSLVGAVGTLPVGQYVDRANRTRLLAGSVLLWAVAMAVSATATGFWYLLVVRAFLGLVTATAGPAVASLIGDFVPARDRGRIWGLVLGGELLGSGLGFVVAGAVGSALSWRWAFAALVLPALAVAWAVWRHLPEPARGGQSRLEPGAEEVLGVEDVGDQPPRHDEAVADSGARQAVREAHVEPDPDRVLTGDPRGRSLGWAVRYVLSVPTNVVLIVASALTYYFFAGVRGFAIIFVTDHYGLRQSVASVLVLVLGLGALAGVAVGGRLSDRLMRRRRFDARILIPVVALVVTVVLFAPAIWTTAVGVALPLFVLAGFSLAAATPAIDAARLDVMHPHLWGRAESVRTVLRTLGEAAAPTVFGLVSERAFGGGGTGLEYTFLVMLAPVLVAALVLLRGLRTYPRDVATVAASIEHEEEPEPEAYPEGRS